MHNEKKEEEGIEFNNWGVGVEWEQREELCVWRYSD